MSEPAFYNIPPEIWEKVVSQVGRRDLAALAVASRRIYPIANALLYDTLELSFCKCSESYYSALARTIINNTELAALITNLYIDMKVPCKVKTATSVENLHSTRTWRTQYRPHHIFLPGRADYGRYDPKSQVDWNRAAVQALLDSQVFDIFPQLSNVERITVILGHFQQDSEFLSSMFSGLPGSVLPSLQQLKVYDASLVATPSLRLVSVLRVLDLGYVAVDNSVLCSLVGQNAGSLEEIRLNWIMEPRQVPSFTGYSGAAIKGLKVFTSRGQHTFSFDGLKRLLGGATLLEDLRLESLSVPSAATWNHVLSSLLIDYKWNSDIMRVLKFGAATGCGEFWDSVAQFLGRCGSGLVSLCINGSPRGPTGHFPSRLLNYFLAHPQLVLKDLVLIWRDDVGLPPRSAVSLASFAPSLEMLHTCFSVPFDTVNSLLGLISPFPNLYRVHLTFLKHAQFMGDAGLQQAIEYSKAYTRVCNDITQKGPTFQDFIRRAAARHTELSEVSWSVYDRMAYSAEGPKAYVKIKRPAPLDSSSSSFPESERTGSDSSPCPVLEDLGEECRKYESMESLRFRCSVGTKKVLLNQRPGWREDMGNPFLETHRVCQYAEFNEGGSGNRPLRREL